MMTCRTVDLLWFFNFYPVLQNTFPLIHRGPDNAQVFQARRIKSSYNCLRVLKNASSIFVFCFFLFFLVFTDTYTHTDPHKEKKSSRNAMGQAFETGVLHY